MRNALLAMLADEPKHGLLLKQEFEETFGDFWPPVNVGQVYAALQRLEKDGLVEGEEVEQEGRRRKFTYGLTAAGRHELRNWFAEDGRQSRIRDEFFLKLIMAQHTKQAHPAEIIERRRAHNLNELRSIEEALVNAEGATALLAEGAALRLQADIRWLDICEERLRTGILE